jgi:hypothetical protein
MKGTSPSQASRDLSRLRLTATECQDGEAKRLARRNFMVINSFWRGKILAIVTAGVPTGAPPQGLQPVQSFREELLGFNEVVPPP